MADRKGTRKGNRPRARAASAASSSQRAARDLIRLLDRDIFDDQPYLAVKKDVFPLWWVIGLCATLRTRSLLEGLCALASKDADDVAGVLSRTLTEVFLQGMYVFLGQDAAAKRLIRSAYLHHKDLASTFSEPEPKWVDFASHMPGLGMKPKDDEKRLGPFEFHRDVMAKISKTPELRPLFDACNLAYTHSYKLDSHASAHASFTAVIGHRSVYQAGTVVPFGFELNGQKFMPPMALPFDTLVVHRRNQVADRPSMDERLETARTYVAILASRVYASVPRLDTGGLVAHTKKYPLDFGVELYDPDHGPPNPRDEQPP